MIRALLKRFIKVKMWCSPKSGYVSVFFLCVCVGTFRYIHEKGCSSGWAEVLSWDGVTE